MGSYVMRIDKQTEKQYQNLTVAAALTMVAEEKAPTHPYWGLRDSKGWLSRYPETTSEGELAWTRAEIKAYLSTEGVGFDVFQVYGPSPYDRRELDRGMPAGVLGRLVKEAGRYDYFPYYRGGFPVHDSVDLKSFRALYKGAELKRALEKLGIKTSCSLFTLAKKSAEWIGRKARTQASLDSLIAVLKQDYKSIYVGSYCLEFTKELQDSDSVAWGYAYRCVKKYRRRESLSTRWDYTTKMSGKTLVRHLAKKTRETGEYEFRSKKICGVLHTVEDTGHRTSLGKIFEVKTSTGPIYFGVPYKGQGDSFYSPIDYYKIEELPFKRVGHLTALKYQDTWFVFRKKFEDHIEHTGSLKEAVTAYYEVKKDSIRKEEILETRTLSLREFREYTRSCFAGTSSFLSSNMRHIYNIISPYSEWDAVPGDVMDIPWSLTEEAMSRIEHRF